VKLRLGGDLLELFPDAMIGVVVVHGLDNTGSDPEIAAGLRRAEATARAAVGATPIVEVPRVACWREAYRKFGGAPKKNPPSLERLVRRVNQGEALRAINPLVDLYNAISLEHLLPAGGEDLAPVVGDVVLCRAGATEPPVQLLGDAEARSPYPGEVIYRDDVAALCRRWNWKEAERTKLTATTRDALLVLEALPPAARTDLAAALADLAARVTRFCGGATRTAILDGVSPSLDLTD
jgi:DNA/RNA-binding domain of Phe-tRNA-synthetase-like protein